MPSGFSKFYSGRALLGGKSFLYFDATFDPNARTIHACRQNCSSLADRSTRRPPCSSSLLPILPVTLAYPPNPASASTLAVYSELNPDPNSPSPYSAPATARTPLLRNAAGIAASRAISTAFDAYLKAVNDEHLTSVTLDRDNLLYNKGAIAKSQLDAAQNGEDDARADLLAAEQQLKILGVDKIHPSETVRIYAPSSGVIIAQNVAASGAAGISYAGSAGSFTIADLSHVWIICDVYENDLAGVHLGQHADIQLNAFPGKLFSGTISDIGAQLDPNLRTAKVRIQVANPQRLLRLGMFATGTLEGSRPEQETAVPAAAVVQLHDRSYVYVPAGNGNFKRILVKTGTTLPGNLLEIQAGLDAGQQVVGNGLDLENTADQQ